MSGVFSFSVCLPRLIVDRGMDDIQRSSHILCGRTYSSRRRDADVYG